MTVHDLGSCLYCGRPAEERHHFTASLRGQLDYLDPQATIPLCVRCHKAEHAAWRAAGLAAFDDPLLARVCRVTWTVGRLVGRDHGQASVLRPVHPVLVVIRDGVTARVCAEVPR